jgi:DNA-binding transcriptional regulator LsrR (DeoR family)
MPTINALTPEQVEEAIRLYDDGKGMRQKDIAKRFHCSLTTINRYLVKEGVKGYIAKRSWDEDRMDEIVSLYWGPERLNQYEVADRLGLSQRTIRRRLRKHRVMVRTSRSSPEYRSPRAA